MAGRIEVTEDTAVGCVAARTLASSMRGLGVAQSVVVLVYDDGRVEVGAGTAEGVVGTRADIADAIDRAMGAWLGLLRERVASHLGGES